MIIREWETIRFTSANIIFFVNYGCATKYLMPARFIKMITYLYAKTKVDVSNYI
ncbi:MAG: hypothetical protein N2558_04260 [Patescibacteria group bacterium]|nr:hypothetical protein [Patescibacteria group bacterium]